MVLLLVLQRRVLDWPERPITLRMFFRFLCQLVLAQEWEA